jgi:hypothetical protein
LIDGIAFKANRWSAALVSAAVAERRLATVFSPVDTKPITVDLDSRSAGPGKKTDKNFSACFQFSTKRPCPSLSPVALELRWPFSHPRLMAGFIVTEERANLSPTRLSTAGPSFTGAHALE